jgi:hypothetical protein
MQNANIGPKKPSNGDNAVTATGKAKMKSAQTVDACALHLSGASDQPIVKANTKEISKLPN